MSEVPSVISCPVCLSTQINTDPEGGCTCSAGHIFWSTESPEWQMLRRAQDAEARARTIAEEMVERRAMMVDWSWCVIDVLLATGGRP